MKKYPYSNAFSLLSTMIMLILLSSMALLTLSLSSKVTSETASQYKKEQAVLWAQSYTAYAVMALTEHNQTKKSCIDTLSAVIGKSTPLQRYDVYVHISYIGAFKQIQNCHSILNHTSTTGINAIIDVYVTYTQSEENHQQNVTYHTRTLKKISL